MLDLAITAGVVCIAVLKAQQCHYKHLESQLNHKDTAKLAATLEAGLADLDDLKSKVNQLLLRSGLGR